MDDRVRRAIQGKQVEEALRADFEASLPSRVHRYLEVDAARIVPHAHFAAASTECVSLYRDGHFYGCIALAQAVAEAVARYLCERNRWKPSNDYKRNVNKLASRGVISKTVTDAFGRIWNRRNDFHHLNPEVPTDREELARLAREVVPGLADVEREVFGFQVVDGRLVPDNPKYWPAEGGVADVYLRLEP